jgi:hypothetical protein
MFIKSQDNLKVIARSYGLEGPGLIPDRGKIFSGANPTSYLTVKRPWYKSDYSPPSSAKVKNDGAYLPSLTVIII